MPETRTSCTFCQNSVLQTTIRHRSGEKIAEDSSLSICIDPERVKDPRTTGIQLGAQESHSSTSLPKKPFHKLGRKILFSASTDSFKFQRPIINFWGQFYYISMNMTSTSLENWHVPIKKAGSHKVFNKLTPFWFFL